MRRNAGSREHSYLLDGRATHKDSREIASTADPMTNFSLWGRYSEEVRNKALDQESALRDFKVEYGHGESDYNPNLVVGNPLRMSVTDIIAKQTQKNGAGDDAAPKETLFERGNDELSLFTNANDLSPISFVSEAKSQGAHQSRIMFRPTSRVSDPLTGGETSLQSNNANESMRLKSLELAEERANASNRLVAGESTNMSLS